MLGDIEFSIDGEPLTFADTVTYRGMMFTGVPNMAWVFGYFRASWTLRTGRARLVPVHRVLSGSTGLRGRVDHAKAAARL